MAKRRRPKGMPASAAEASVLVEELKCAQDTLALRLKYGEPVEIGFILLGHNPDGGRLTLPIHNTDLSFVPGDVPTVCPTADPQIQAKHLLEIVRSLTERHMIPPGCTIHWHGHRKTPMSDCVCTREDIVAQQAPLSVPAAGSLNAGPTESDRLSEAEQRIVEVIRDAGHRLTTNAILTALQAAYGVAGESTTKQLLAGLVRRRILTNRQDVRPRGYGLSGWT